VTVYAPDSDFFIHVQRLRFVDEFVKCGPLPVIVTDVVWEELVTTKFAHVNAEMQRLLGAVAGAPTSIEPMSSEASTFASLQQPPKTEGPGEHSIISLTMHNPDVVPVLIDKKALHRAIEELRRPLLAMHGFLDALMKTGTIPKHLGTELASAYRKAASASRPQWW
jgi:hypothetical protein